MKLTVHLNARFRRGGLLGLAILAILLVGEGSILPSHMTGSEMTAIYQSLLLGAALLFIGSVCGDASTVQGFFILPGLWTVISTGLAMTNAQHLTIDLPLNVLVFIALASGCVLVLVSGLWWMERTLGGDEELLTWDEISTE